MMGDVTTTRSTPSRVQLDGSAESVADVSTVTLPDPSGHFGRFGGRFVPEALVAALDQVAAEYAAAQADPAFRAELDGLLRDYTGRPSPLTDVPRLAEHAG